MQEWANIVATIGVPAGILFLLGLGGWRAGWAAANWIAPRADAVLKAHLGMMTSVNDNMVRIGNAITDHDQSAKDQAQNILVTQEAIVKTQEKIIEKLDAHSEPRGKSK